MASEAVRRREVRARALMAAVTLFSEIVAEACRERARRVVIDGEVVPDVHRLQLDLIRELSDAAVEMLECDVRHFDGPGDEMAPRRRLRQAVADLVVALADLPEPWRPFTVPTVSNAVGNPHTRRVLVRLVRLALLRLARAAEQHEPPGSFLARAAAAGLAESLRRLERAERDLRLSPAAVALTWRRREEAIAAFDDTWRRVVSRLRRLYRQVGLDDLLAAPAAVGSLPADEPQGEGPDDGGPER